MDYSREYATPSEVSAIRAELIGMNRALRDLQSTSASTSFRLAKSGENDAPGLQDILIRALVAQFIANKELHSPGGGPPAEEVAERFYGRGPSGHAITKTARTLTNLFSKAAVSPASTTAVGYPPSWSAAKIIRARCLPWRRPRSMRRLPGAACG